MKNLTYLIGSLTAYGGIERIITEKANALAETGCYDVTVICVWQKSSNDNVFDLSPLVTQVCMGGAGKHIATFVKSPFAYIYNCVRNELQLKKRIDVLLRQRHTDVLIVTVNYVPMSFYTFRGKKIVESHGNVVELTKLRTFPFLSKWLTRIAARCASVVVALTYEDARNWQWARRVQVIPNFVSLDCNKLCNYDSKRVVALGRLDEQKGFDMLIDAWNIVSRKHPEWKLDIYGNGCLKESLQNQIADLELTHCIALHPFTKDVVNVLASVSFYAMSSRHEGFALVLIEAMSCGLPCVAFDCPSGPRELIENEKNGVLVSFRGLTRDERVQNFAVATCWMIEQDELPAMGQCAKATSQQYTVEKVLLMWKELFESM